MEKVSKRKRTYVRGKPLGNDLRSLIIDEIIHSGGNIITREYPGNFSAIAKRFSVHDSTVKNIWSNYCENKTLDPKKKKGGNPSKLHDGDLELIETLTRIRPTISLNELKDDVELYDPKPDGVSISAISRALKQRMPSGLQYSRKKVNKVAIERFTPVNMVYTQMFINYLHSKDPRKLKFFDEAGLKLPHHGTRYYRHAPVGERCIELARYHQTPNITLNLLAGLEGVVYANTVKGAASTVHLLQFFGEAAQAGNVITQRPALEYGDIVVMDNCPTHHYDGEEVLTEFLNEIGIELVYTPTYSPDFNPTEFVFGKIRTEMLYALWELTNRNLVLSVYEAIDKVTEQDMIGFFRATSYI
jgi:transposase